MAFLLIVVAVASEKRESRRMVGLCLRSRETILVVLEDGRSFSDGRVQVGASEEPAEVCLLRFNKEDIVG